MFAVFRFPFRGNIGPACLPVRPVAEWLRGFLVTKRKGTIGNGPKVVNRRRVAVWKAKEKGSGKEKCPLDPLKRKGQGKRTRPGFLRNLFFQDRARAREAKASVRVFFFRGGRGGGTADIRSAAPSPQPSKGAKHVETRIQCRGKSAAPPALLWLWLSRSCRITGSRMKDGCVEIVL